MLVCFQKLIVQVWQFLLSSKVKLHVMSSGVINCESLILQLFDVGAIKFGNYTLKSGVQSPVYCDLRVIISFPSLLSEVSELLWELSSNLEYSTICGVPYTALPIATCISVKHDIPMLIRRKEAKDYGTKKMVEGYYDKGARSLVVEDVVSTGSSVQETANLLVEHGLVVTDAVVLLNRQQGGKENLAKAGINLKSVMTLTEVVECLCKHKKIKPDFVDEVNKFLARFQSTSSTPMYKPAESPAKVYGKPDGGRGSYAHRGRSAKHNVTKKLFEIMESKMTNLCLSADVESSVDLIELVDLLGPVVCIVKTHVDILDDYSPTVVKQLVELSQRHNFLLFEDRKYADIGNTVKRQYAGGIFKTAEWSHITNAHSVSGPGVIDGLKAAADGHGDRGCLLIAEMSSKGNLASGQYTEATVRIANDHEDFVMGFICTSKVSSNPSHVFLTPGVKLLPGKDSLGQQYLTPDEVIGKRNCDVIIVGRGIVDSANRFETALAFRNAGWAAYQKRLV